MNVWKTIMAEHKKFEGKGPVKRYKDNPILTKDDVPYPVETVHNAGVTKLQDRYIMLFRSHLRTGRSIMGIAESEDGLNFKVRPEPFLVPAKEGLFADYTNGTKL